MIFTGTSNFINNSALFGGAIHPHADNTSLSFTGNSHFINNTADYQGGAIFSAESGPGKSLLRFTGTSYFSHNSAGISGGGMFLVNSTISILSKTNIYWESNFARLGGAIYALNMTYIQKKMNAFFNSLVRICPMVMMLNFFSRITLLMQAVCYMVVQ